MSEYGGGGGGKGGGGYGGGGGGPQPLYGVWIDQAMQSSDPNQLKAVLKEARKYFDDRRPHVLYGVVIDQAIARNNPDELQELLKAAKAAVGTDLKASVQKLESHLSSGSGGMGKK